MCIRTAWFTSELMKDWCSMRDMQKLTRMWRNGGLEKLWCRLPKRQEFLQCKILYFVTENAPWGTSGSVSCCLWQYDSMQKSAQVMLLVLTSDFSQLPSWIEECIPKASDRTLRVWNNADTLVALPLKGRLWNDADSLSGSASQGETMKWWRFF